MIAHRPATISLRDILIITTSVYIVLVLYISDSYVYLLIKFGVTSQLFSISISNYLFLSLSTSFTLFFVSIYLPMSLFYVCILLSIPPHTPLYPLSHSISTYITLPLFISLSTSLYLPISLPLSFSPPSTLFISLLLSREWPAFLRSLKRKPSLFLNCVGGRQVADVSRALLPGSTIVTYGGFYCDALRYSKELNEDSDVLILLR